MKWSEFAALLSGLSADTAIGRVVSIRSENDRERLKEFSPEMRQMRAEWRNRQAKQVSMEQRMDFDKQMRNAFVKMAGGESK